MKCIRSSYSVRDLIRIDRPDAEKHNSCFLGFLFFLRWFWFPPRPDQVPVTPDRRQNYLAFPSCGPSTSVGYVQANGLIGIFISQKTSGPGRLVAFHSLLSIPCSGIFRTWRMLLSRGNQIVSGFISRTELLDPSTGKR